jgi:hypothetical protein
MDVIKLVVVYPGILDVINLKPAVWGNIFWLDRTEVGA